MLTLWLCGYVFWIDLTDEIYNKFKDTYDWWLSDEYLNVPYNPNFSKDPFGEAMQLYEWMSSQAKVAWVMYVERALWIKGCSLSKQKQWAIEYYFLPEFRSEIVRVMKMEMGDFGSNNYTFNEDEIMKYCTEFYNCVSYKPGWDAVDDTQKITSGTPEDIKTNCKEFFQTNYREWQAEEKRVQNLQVAWLWNDKYFNATVEESPYDIMTDLGVIWELFYLQAKKPITPVFFNLPVFSKSKEALLAGQNWWGGEVEETYWGVVPMEEVSLWWSNKVLERQVVVDEQVSLWWNGTTSRTTLTSDKQVNLWWTDKVLDSSVSLDRQINNWVSLNNVERTTTLLDRTQNVWWVAVNTNTADWLQVSNWSIKPLSRSKWLIMEWYDSLVEWLWAYRLNDDKSANYWSLCIEGEAEPEPESVQQEHRSTSRDVVLWTNTFNSTKVEYQELVDYMIEAATSYASLPEDKAKEIEKKAWAATKYDWAYTAEQTETLAKKILGCYQACVWLSVDEQFACMLKCSCGEINSPIFDPEVNPGMWPIFMIRYCAVPAVNPRYYYGWSDWSDWWSSTLVRWWSVPSWKWSTSSWRWSSWRWWAGWWGASWGGDIWWGSSSDWWNSNADSVIWTSFNPGWTKMVAMEKWTDEILWVVEKLAREWRLWMWTQQYNYLDSSTKKTDIADTFSFTIAADSEKVSEQVWEPTEEYTERTMKTRDNNWLVANHVANPLDNPATKNYFCLVGNCAKEGIVWDAASSNSSQWYLNVAPWFVVDQSENSNAARYAEISKLFSDWLDFEWAFWADKVDYLKDMDEYAKALYAKKW